MMKPTINKMTYPEYMISELY